MTQSTFASHLATLNDPHALLQAFEQAKTAEDWHKVRQRLGDTPQGGVVIRELLDRITGDQPEKVFRRGMTQWLLGRLSQAVEEFQDLKDNPLGDYFMGLCLKELGRMDEAEQAFLRAEKKDNVLATLARVSMLIAAHKTPEAHDILAKIAKKADGIAEYWFLRGMVADLNGHTQEARDNYEKALQLDPEHPGALFRTAYYNDLRGDDHAALAAYEVLRETTPLHTNTLINLGLMYEDREEYDKAIQCYRMVLQCFPNHPRARLYLKDAIASTTMVFDEEERERFDKLATLLKTPVTEFELSVRSRNCLARMNIQTLGDLIKRTEQELLSYKNFGETSLAEIKSILQKKNLRLGMVQGDSGVPVLEGSPMAEKEEVLKKNISDLNFNVRVRKVMEKLNINSLGELIQHKESEFTSMKNFGKNSLAELKKKLAEFNLQLAPE